MAMTKGEFRAALHRHGYTLQEWADEWGHAYETVRRWGASYGVPRWAQRMLALMDQHGRRQIEGLKRNSEQQRKR